MHRTDIYVLPKLGKCLIHEQKYSKLIAVYLFFRFACFFLSTETDMYRSLYVHRACYLGGNRDDIDTKVVYLSIDLCFC